jgi:hypothetical protein
LEKAKALESFRSILCIGVVILTLLLICEMLLTKCVSSGSSRDNLVHMLSLAFRSLRDQLSSDGSFSLLYLYGIRHK